MRADVTDEVAGELSGLEAYRSLLEAPSPAVLQTYRRDSSALVTPVWFRWHEDAAEVVIAEGDVKLGHLRRDPRCALLVFEAVRPFRGIELRGEAQLLDGDAGVAREAIASHYLGAADGLRFAAERTTPGVLVRLAGANPRVWDLSSILPVST